MMIFVLIFNYEKIYFVYRGVHQKNGKILFLKDEAWAVYENGKIVGAAGWTWVIEREEYWEFMKRNENS